MTDRYLETAAAMHAKLPLPKEVQATWERANAELMVAQEAHTAARERERAAFEAAYLGRTLPKIIDALSTPEGALAVEALVGQMYRMPQRPEALAAAVARGWLEPSEKSPRYDVTLDGRELWDALDKVNRQAAKGRGAR
jgi:hypothetical protein